MEKLEHPKIPLSKVILATNHFGPENFIGQGAFGPVYKGQLFYSGRHYNVAVKRLNERLGQGQREFLMLSRFKHKNLVSLIGFCDEGSDKLLVYEQEIHGSLDRYLDSVDLTWIQRLRICLGAAHGLNYLHSGVGGLPSVLHLDIKSANVLLDENWEAKLSDFRFSKIGPSNQLYSFLVSYGHGTVGYVDPAYEKTGILTKESDVYSFGVLLFEVLCGRLGYMSTYNEELQFLSHLARLHYEQGRLDDIINPLLRQRMSPYSLGKFSEIAYQCLKEDRRERPKMDLVVQELQNALEIQLGYIIKTPGWDRAIKGRWSFHLESNHKLKKITVLHGDEIYSLSFTTKDPDGQLHGSKTFGSEERSLCKSEFNLDDDENLTGINGTFVGFDVQLITSLSFVTNKRTYQPFGQIRGCEFWVSCYRDEFVGFYGYSGDSLNAIGLYSLI